MQIQITPTPAKNQILFCKVDCYENQKSKDAQGKSITVQVKAASLEMIMGPTEEMTMARILRKFPKVKPVLLKCKIIKSWRK
jgi:hypothetical protein